MCEKIVSCSKEPKHYSSDVQTRPSGTKENLTKVARSAVGCLLEAPDCFLDIHSACSAERYTIKRECLSSLPLSPRQA